MSNFVTIPLTIESPEFPSLYWPFGSDDRQPRYIFTSNDIWKFTLYWTLITVPLAHLVVALWAIFMQFLSANDRSRYLKAHSSTNSNRKSKSKFESNSRKRQDERSRRATTSDEEDMDESELSSDEDTESQDTEEKHEKGIGKVDKDPSGSLYHSSGENEEVIRGGKRRPGMFSATTTSTLPDLPGHASSSTSRSKSSSEKGVKGKDERDKTTTDDTTTTNNGNANETAKSHKPRHTSSAGGRSERKTKQPKPKKLSAKNRKLLGASPFQSTIKYSGMILAIYLIIGAIEALIAGSVVGLILGAIYHAGYFRMSTWTPLFWGVINMLVLILGSFRISGGM